MRARNTPSERYLSLLDMLRRLCHAILVEGIQWRSAPHLPLPCHTHRTSTHWLRRMAPANPPRIPAFALLHTREKSA